MELSDEHEAILSSSLYGLGVCIKLAKQNHVYHSIRVDGTAAVSIC